jgi:hypothetical protein
MPVRNILLSIVISNLAGKNSISSVTIIVLLLLLIIISGLAILLPYR